MSWQVNPHTSLFDDLTLDEANSLQGVVGNLMLGLHADREHPAFHAWAVAHDAQHYGPFVRHAAYSLVLFWRTRADEATRYCQGFDPGFDPCNLPSDCCDSD